MASTVGTIMALLVFLTFLSLITNQYVPVWMKDSESGHMGEALGQMGNFKSYIDIQILTAQQAVWAQQHYIPVTTFSTVKLGVDGVPIFSSPTVGQLVVDQTQAPWTVWFRYSISGNNTMVPEATCSCGGNVVLTVFNRYYPMQSIAYENGALIRSQADGQVVKAPPSFQVSVPPAAQNATVAIDYVLIQLFGSGGVSGVGAEGLLGRAIGVDLQSYTNINTAIWVNSSTQHGAAWYYFFNNTLAGAYSAYYKGTDYNTRSGFVYAEAFDAGGKVRQLKVDNPIFFLQTLWNTAKSWYDVTLEFKTPGVRNGVTVPAISPFRLQHAFVNVAAGERGNTVGI